MAQTASTYQTVENTAEVQPEKETIRQRANKLSLQIAEDEAAQAARIAAHHQWVAERRLWRKDQKQSKKWRGVQRQHEERCSEIVFWDNPICQTCGKDLRSITRYPPKTPHM